MTHVRSLLGVSFQLSLLHLCFSFRSDMSRNGVVPCLLQSAYVSPASIWVKGIKTPVVERVQSGCSKPRSRLAAANTPGSFISRLDTRWWSWCQWAWHCRRRMYIARRVLNNADNTSVGCVVRCNSAACNGRWQRIVWRNGNGVGSGVYVRVMNVEEEQWRPIAASLVHNVFGVSCQS